MGGRKSGVARTRAKAWYEENKERALAAARQKYAQNPEPFLKSIKRWRDKNRDEIAAKRRALPSDHPLRAAARLRTKNWVTANPERKRLSDIRYREENMEKILEQQRAARKDEKNRAKFKAASARRKADRAKRVPKWLTVEDFRKIREMYALAEVLTAETGEPWHVDHIIPLRGKYVSGLHVPGNLQVISARENMKKHNKFEPFNDLPHPNTELPAIPL